MAGDQSEEKTLPASAKKLRDAREKGQVARSKDLVTGVALAGSLGFLLAAGGAIVTASGAMFTRAGDVAAGDYAVGVEAMGHTIRDAALWTVAPLLLLVPSLVVLTSMVVLKGIPFSIDPITPKLDKLNPAEGFKKLFAVKSLIELIKSLVKTVAIVAGFVVVMAGGANALIDVPSCGLGCFSGVLRGLMTPLLEVAVGLFLVAGLADVGLQRWLFLRDQKMSITESKRERKDQDGDPHIKRERRRLMREAQRASAALGIKAATIMIHDGGSVAVGLKFKISEMPVPVVVVRGRGDRGAALMAQALPLGLLVAEDAELANGLFKVQPGQPVPEQFYRMVAMAFGRAGGLKQ